jgi:C4-dicarboxylate-specific signal transduction histidine kinase
LARRVSLPPHAVPIAAFGIVAVGLLAAAPLLSRSLRQETRRRAESELGAIAELKAAQIGHWRADHIRVVGFGAAYPAVRATVEAASRGVLDRALGGHASEVLGQLGELQHYERLAVVADDGVEVTGWTAPGRSRIEPAAALIDEALNATDGTASELRLDPSNRPYLDVAAAVLTEHGKSFVLFARADAAALFTDVLERWPVPSQTAAGSLGIREGDWITLLVPLSSVAIGHPGVERIPASDLRRPVVKAFGGASGLIEGLDFAGHPIFVASREIPETRWRVQAKIEVAEMAAPLRRPLGIIYGLGGALLAAAAVMLILSGRQQRARALLDARLRDAQERLALAVTGTHGVWDWDLVRGVLHLEPPLELPGGPPTAELSGTVEEILARVVHPDDTPGVRERVEAHLRGETPVLDVEHRLPASGGPAWIRVRGRVSRRTPEGQPLRFAAVVSDVTERRQMQAQLELSQRMAGLGTLAAGVAHEINNPLASVSANLEYVAQRVEGDVDLATVVAEAQDGAERVRDVVRGLRAFSAPTGRERRPADVRGELEAAIRLARNEIRHRARLEVDVGDLPLVEAGAHELGQVFLNLLLNAAQAIPEGRAEENLIEVVARRTPEGAASISIRDSGVGIPPQVLERIFEPFFTTKPLGVGTGLGLAIAHRIVVDAGGRIEVETQLGRGSAFRVVLPPARAALAPAVTAPATPAPSAAPIHVLIVDDDPLVIRAVGRILGPGFEVTTSPSAADALARIERGEGFQAVLCDLMMPQMTGMELHARVAARDPAMARRMIFMTGGAFTEAAARFVAESRAPCFDKPFEPALLRAAVERAAAA